MNFDTATLHELFGTSREKRIPAHEVLASVNSQRSYYQAELDALSPANQYTIDEVAIAFADEVEMLRFVSVLNRLPGVEHFNGAQDKVDCNPIDSAYKVQYEWLSTEYGWRVEAMTVLAGHSPVHAHRQYLAQYPPNAAGNLGWIHVSFNLPGMAAYLGACEELMGAGWVLAQDCTSTYGRFSYWSPNSTVMARLERAGAAALYLKPRVNLRDES